MTATVPSIPDDLIPDILLRLPAAAVVRSRAVCKQWRDLVDDAGFLVEHHRRRPPAPLLCFRRDDPPLADPDHTTTTSPRKFRVRLDAVDLRAGETNKIFSFAAPARKDHWRWGPLRIGYTPGSHYERDRLVFKDDGAFAVHGSCAGVLLVSYKSATYLVNPARRRWSRTQSGAGCGGVLGFYLHRPSGEFRALCHVAKSYLANDFRILTLPPAREVQRRILGGPHTAQQLMGAVPTESPPALVAGNLHWLRQGDGGILVFDTVAETARLMRPPPPVDGAHVAAQTLLEIDGKLTMTTVTVAGTVNLLTAAELWVLRDYERDDDDSWARQLGPVPLPADEIARLGGGAVAVVSMEGDVVVRCAECMLQCDAMGRVRGRYEMEGRRFVGVPHLFKESLVPHAHVDGREVLTGFEHIQSPPFFLDIYQDDD